MDYYGENISFLETDLEEDIFSLYVADAGIHDDSNIVFFQRKTGKMRRSHTAKILALEGSLKKTFHRGALLWV